MKKKQLIIIIIMIAVILPILFILFRNGESEDAEKEDNINMEKSRKEEINDLTKEGEEGREYPNTGTGSMELEEKIELTDYVELSIEDFLRETGVPLHQKKDNKNVWISEDNVLWVGTINGQVAYISISQLTGNKEIKKKIAQEGHPYMIAGISLNDEMSDLYDTVLKNASYGWGDGGYYYYTGLDLCKFGIEKLTLMEMGTVDGIEADFDMSLKESAEGLEYIWEEKVLYKEGTRNDKLAVCEISDSVMAGSDEKQEDRKSVV